MMDIVNQILISDVLHVVGALLVVFIAMVVHTGSLFISAMGMLHVVMAFPAAYTTYRLLFGIKCACMHFTFKSYISSVRPPTDPCAAQCRHCTTGRLTRATAVADLSIRQTSSQHIIWLIVSSRQCQSAGCCLDAIELHGAWAWAWHGVTWTWCHMPVPSLVKRRAISRHECFAW